MNITVVCDVLGNETNGTTVATMNLIRFLQKHHNVKILCADESKKGLQNYYVVPTLSLGILDKFIKMNNVSLAKPDDEIIKQALEGAEHVHIMLPFGLGHRTLKFCKEMGLSTTAGFHAQAENLTSHVRLHNFNLLNQAIYKNFYKSFYKDIDGIHFPTKFIRDIFEKNIKHKTNGYVISNGVNTSITTQKVAKADYLQDKIVVLSTGRFAVEKSQHNLIKAVGYSKYKDKIQLILAGQGPLEKKYKKMARKLPNYPVFQVFERDKMPYVYNSCDIYCHPAEMELEGIACLEAICCGKLVLVSDSKKSATKNFVVDERCIFKSHNPKDLARCLDYWIEHPEEKRICEQKYLQSAINYNQDECMKKMEQMIFEVHNNKIKNTKNG